MSNLSANSMAPIHLGSVVIDTPVILAPMSGVTDLPYRRLARALGAPMVVSELIASRPWCGPTGRR